MALAFGLLGSSGLIAADTAGHGDETRPGSTTNAPATGQVSASAGNQCLECHGPFAKLTGTSTNFIAASGEKINPHRYVPHDSKLESDIPDCTRCHTAHSLASLPAKGSVDLTKVTVEWCYSCHHEKNFQSCKDCHP